MKPLPRGRHGLSPEFVARDQRRRLIRATAAALDELGFEATTVSAIATRARVSKSDFYRHFDSKDECFAAAYDEAVAHLQECVQSACARRRNWADTVCAGISAVLGRIAADPAEANMLLVEGLRAGPSVYQRYQAAVDSFVPCLRSGGPVAAAPGLFNVATDEAVVGGIASLLSRHVLAGEAASVEKMYPEVAQFALTPYLGVAEARRIISSA